MQTHWYMRASAVIYDWLFYQSVIDQFVVVGKRFAVAFRVWIQLNTLKVFCVRTRRLSSSSIVITDFHLSLHTFTSLFTMFTPTLVSTKSHKLSLKIIKRPEKTELMIYKDSLKLIRYVYREGENQVIHQWKVNDFRMPTKSVLILTPFKAVIRKNKQKF